LVFCTLLQQMFIGIDNASLHIYHHRAAEIPFFIIIIHDDVCEVFFLSLLLKLKFSIAFSATPSAPYDIALLNCDGHSMVLNWKKPLHSGGAEVKEYYVDKRRSGTTMWREVHIPSVSERLYKVQ